MHILCIQQFKKDTNLTHLSNEGYLTIKKIYKLSQQSLHSSTRELLHVCWSFTIQNFFNKYSPGMLSTKDLYSMCPVHLWLSDNFCL